MTEQLSTGFFNDDKEHAQRGITNVTEQPTPFNLTAEQVNLKVDDLNTHIENIERTIVGLETTKMYFINQKGELEEQLQLLNEFSEEPVDQELQFKVYQATFNGADLIIIEMPFKLPIYKKIIGKKYDYYKELNSTYTKPLTEALNRFIQKSSLEKLEEVFVLISHYAPNSMIFDTDNRFHSFIFNSLRASKIITDDNHYRLSYMENGYANADSFKVAVTVTCKKNYIEAVEYSNYFR